MEEPSTSAWRLRQGTMERKMSDTACTVFNELRLEGKLCDVVIRVNGIEFNAHKNILCSCSPYFRTLFTSSWSSREKEVYNIPGMLPDTMKLIIEYAYTRTVPVTAENVERLLPAADQFNVLGSSAPVASSWNTSCAWKTASGSTSLRTHCCPDLRHKAYMYILHHFEEMMKVSEKLLELSAFELRDIIEKDELNIEKEDVVFDTILKWIVQDPDVRKRSIAILLPKVYICGGFNGTECLFTAEFYTPETNQWTTIAPMGSRRSGVGVIAYGECVYAVGGFNGANRLRSAEAYSPLTNIWRTLPTMFDPRSNFGIEVVDDLLFVVGGFNGFTTTFNVECYDEKTDGWYDAHDMGIYRSALSCCLVPGLPNVRQYAAPRDNLLRLLSREEQIKYSASTSTLAV